MVSPVLQAMLLPIVVVRLAGFPEREVPKCAIVPVPDAFLLKVAASDPEVVLALSLHLLPDEVVDILGGDGGKMATLLLAEVLSVSPALLIGRPEVARALKLRPALSTAGHTSAAAATFWSQNLDFDKMHLCMLKGIFPQKR